MIETLFDNAHLVHQTATNDELSNPPIAGMIDRDGTIILSQEGRHICVDAGSIPDFCKMLRDLGAIKAKARK